MTTMIMTMMIMLTTTRMMIIRSHSLFQEGSRRVMPSVHSLRSYSKQRAVMTTSFYLPSPNDVIQKNYDVIIHCIDIIRVIAICLFRWSHKDKKKILIFSTLTCLQEPQILISNRQMTSHGRNMMSWHIDIIIVIENDREFLPPIANWRHTEEIWCHHTLTPL